MLSSPKNRKILKDFLFFRTIMQQQNKFVSEKTKSETHFLLALDAYPQSSAGYIQKLINIKQSSFSTLAKELEVRGLIQNTKDLKDQTFVDIHLKEAAKIASATEAEVKNIIMNVEELMTK